MGICRHFARLNQRVEVRAKERLTKWDRGDRLDRIAGIREIHCVNETRFSLPPMYSALYREHRREQRVKMADSECRG